jgi:hypothetical protein
MEKNISESDRKPEALKYNIAFKIYFNSEALEVKPYILSFNFKLKIIINIF